MANIKGGGSSGGGSSSSKSSGGGGNRSIHPSKSVEDKHPKGQGWAAQPGALAPNGQRSDSYTRQNIADQKSNRNFLAETVEGKPIEQQSQFSEEANNGERRSNNEYQKQKEKTRFLDEAVGGRETAEKKAQDKARSEYQLKQKQDARQRATDATAEADRLEEEKNAKYGSGLIVNPDAEMAADIDRYDTLIAENRAKAEEALAGINTTNKERDTALDEYLKAVDDERAITENATFMNQAEADAASANRKQKEEALKDINRALGNDVYYGLADEAQARDLAEGWAGERAGNTAAAVGTALQWFDQASDDMVRYEYDQEHGEGAWDKAIAGKNVNQIGNAGETLFNAGKGWTEQAQSDWASGTENMTEEEKQIAGLAKTGADMVADMVENFILPGSGRVAMAARVAGQGALTQDARENNDIDTRMAKAAFDGATAFLSEYLMGGAEAVYGKSALGKAIEGAVGEMSPMMKAVFNTEGLEEGMEYALGYLGDKILGFDQNGDWSADELKQQMVVGYIMGVIFNGVAGGLNYDAGKLKAVVDEAVEATAQGITPQEAAEQARLQPNEEVKIDPSKQRAAPAPQPARDSTGTAWTGDWDSWVNAALSGGALTDTDINTIYNRPEARRAFEELKNISLDGMSEEDAKSYIGMAAGTQTIEPAAEAAAEADATAATEPTAEPEQTAAETNANEMPSGAEPAQEANDTAGEIPIPEQANTNENAGQNQQQQSRPLNEEPPEQRREKISQYFTNTLTESGRAEGLDPITYNPTSEAESLTNAAMRLKEDYLGALDNLMKSPAWDGEMVDSAWMIENELFKQWEKTGDRYALDAWKRIETHKISQTAKGLQAVAKQSRPGAAAVLNAITNEISDIRQANAEAKRTGNTKNVVSEEVLTKAEEKANDIARRMAHLENEIDDSMESGLSREEAQAKVKEDYLDLIDEINVFRHTGFIQDAKTNAQMRKSAEKLNTKFRKMLAGEDMDYIQRFAACDAAGIAEDVHYEGKQDFLKRLNTWQKLAQLTGTGTWLRNGVGNGSFGIVDVVSANNPVTWLTDMLVSKKTGQRASAVEAGILSKKARDTAAHALHRSMLEIAANIDLASDTDQTKYDMSRTRTYDPDGNALQRTLSRWEQWNGYMLQSSDALFKGAAEGSVREALIRANGWDADSLTEEQKAQLDEAAKQVAEYRTFQNDSTAAEAANKLRDGINKLFNKNWKQGQFGVGTALMPYTKVPTNLAVKSFEFSPAGAVNGLREAVKVMRDPNATMAQQNKAVTDFGRGVTGTMLIGALAQLIKKYPFFRDWDAEDDKDVKAQNKAEGKYGMQLNLSLIGRALSGEKDTEWRNGDRTVDISSMEPLNQLITTASLLAEPDELDARTIGNAFYKSTRDSALGMPALQTLANIENTVKYTDTPDDGLATLATTLGSTVGNVAGGMIPGPIKHATTAADPFVRDTSGNNSIERSVNQAKSAVPGLRTTLPVKRDAFGNVMTSGDVGTRLANQYSPFKHSQVNQSDVSRELEKVREATDEVLVPSRNPVKKVIYSTDEGKQEIKFSNKDAKDYQALVGKEQELRLKDLFATDLYKNSTPALKAQMIQEVEKYAKDTGKTALAEAFDINYDSEYKDVRNLKDPVDFLMTKTGYNAVTKAEKWDSVDALLQAVRNGKLSDKELDYYEDHIPGFKKMYSMAGSGVGSHRVTDFANALKAQYEGEKRDDARGSDYIKVLGSGKFSAKEADALMDYAPDVKQSTIDRYKERVQYQLGSAGMGKSQSAVWSRIESVVNGQMTNSEFKSWIDEESGIPKKQREEIKDICTNYAKDRHEAGKTVSSIYKSVREAGFTPQKALEFYETIDRDYNGSLSKKEYKNALRKVFGSKDGERIWNNMRKHGVQYVTGRF